MLRPQQDNHRRDTSIVLLTIMIIGTFGYSLFSKMSSKVLQSQTDPSSAYAEAMQGWERISEKYHDEEDDEPPDLIPLATTKDRQSPATEQPPTHQSDEDDKPPVLLSEKQKPASATDQSQFKSKAESLDEQKASASAGHRFSSAMDPEQIQSAQLHAWRDEFQEQPPESVPFKKLPFDTYGWQWTKVHHVHDLHVGLYVQTNNWSKAFYGGRALGPKLRKIVRKTKRYLTFDDGKKVTCAFWEQNGCKDVYYSNGQ